MRVVDSSAQPTAAQVAAARNAGVEAWVGYLASGPDKGLLDPWPDAAFRTVQEGGLATGAFVSGQDDPAWVRDKLAELGIVGILDDEVSVRADGTWTDPWLTTSGCGLYGGAAVMATHRTHGHPFYVVADYPLPAIAQTATWPPGLPLPSPVRPVGWQYGGDWTTPVPGVSVDVSNFDPAILEDPLVDFMLVRTYNPAGGANTGTYLVDRRTGVAVALAATDACPSSVPQFTLSDASYNEFVAGLVAVAHPAAAKVPTLAVSGTIGPQATP